MRPSVSHQTQQLSLQKLRDKEAIKRSFKETLLLGYDHNREGLFNHQLMGLDLSLENEGRGLLRSPTVINKAHKSELQVGLTQNEDNQTNLREKDCGPSKNNFNNFKAQSGEIIEAGVLGNCHQREVTHGLKRISNIGLIKNIPKGVNMFSPLTKAHEDVVRLQNLIQGQSTLKEFISEGNKSSVSQVVKEDEAIHSDPRVDSAPSKRISRIKVRRKPKRMVEFRVGKIIKWNEYYMGRGKKKGCDQVMRDIGDGRTKNQKSEWQVYTRRSKGKEIELANEVGNMGLLESHFHDTWKGSNEQCIDSCHSSNMSSSENFALDEEVFEVVDVDSEKERDAG